MRKLIGVFGNTLPVQAQCDLCAQKNRSVTNLDQKYVKQVLTFVSIIQTLTSHYRNLQFNGDKHSLLFLHPDISLLPETILLKLLYLHRQIHVIFFSEPHRLKSSGSVMCVNPNSSFPAVMSCSTSLQLCVLHIQVTQPETNSTIEHTEKTAHSCCVVAKK